MAAIHTLFILYMFYMFTICIIIMIVICFVVGRRVMNKSFEKSEFVLRTCVFFVRLRKIK